MNENKEALILKLEKRAQGSDYQKKLIVFSIFGFLIFSVFYLNQTTQSNLNVNSSQNREVASIDGKSSFLTDSAYEKEIVNSLNKIVMDESSIGQTATSVDQFVFGELKGFYEVESKEGKISSLKFNTGYLGHKPIVVSKVEDFLNKNKAFFAASFDKVQLLEKKDDKEIYNLLNSQNQVIGKATVTMDQSGALTTLEF